MWSNPSVELEFGKPEIPAVAGAALTNAGMDGWGGRDRTSEWRNQNPLPYRLATPQQAERERLKIGIPADSSQSRSIETDAPFQPT
jgi:hypothetical protein